MSTALISVKNIEKNFLVGTQDVPVLKDISVDIKEEEFCVIVGPSGCGKSTLLHIILGLEEPTKGTVNFLQQDLYTNKDEDFRSVFRKKNIGMIYQQPNWIRSMTVLRNVAFPLLLLGMEETEAFAKAQKQLENVGLAEWSGYIPTELSSGQQQRIALARGLVNDPAVIIADEPTGNLDFDSGQAMMQLLFDLNQQQKKTIIMVTHDLEYLRFASSAIRLLDGKIVAVYDKDALKVFIKDVKSKRGL
jgi:ABC-type lipoprotein export system ATPase subunit